MDRIGRKCFCASGLEEIQIPKTVKTIGAGAFKNCTSLATISMADNCKCCLSHADVPVSARVVLQQEMVWGKPLKRLRRLKEVIIPDGIARVGNYWFWGSGIERVEIPASVREIGVEAFCDCKNLRKRVFKKFPRRKVSIPSSLLRIVHARVFYGCASLTTIELPDTLEEIGIDAFRESGLESFAAPKSVKRIHQGAFCWCSNIRKVELNKGLEVLGTDEYLDSRAHCGVFQESAVDRVSFPQTLKRIE